MLSSPNILLHTVHNLRSVSLRGATKEGDLLKIELPYQIREALIKRSFYTKIDILKLKKAIFEQYTDNQIEECRLIENEMVCSTWLLKNN